MVDLGFSVKKGYGLNNASDIRSVIKNATKDVDMENKDKTIMSKDELQSKKVNETVKDIAKSQVVSTPKTQNQSVNNKASINASMSKIGGNIVNSNPVGGIQNIGGDTITRNGKGDIVKETGISVTNENGVKLGADINGGIEGITKNVGGVAGTTVSTDTLNKKREEREQRKQATQQVMQYIPDYVASVNQSITDGNEDRLTVENIRKAFPEFNSLDDAQLTDLTRDIYNANKLGKEFNLYNYSLQHPELEIEFDNSDQIGNVGRADYLNAMFNSSEAGDNPGLLGFLTLGIAPSSLGTLETEKMKAGADTGEIARGLLNNTWKSIWNAVALTYNFVNHPIESAKMLGGSIVGMGADYALKKTAESQGKTKDEFVDQLVAGMGDGSSVYDKMVKMFVSGGEMGALMKDFFKENYGSAEGFANYVYSDPAGVLSDMIMVTQGMVGLAGKSGLITKSTQKALINKLGWLDPYEAPAKLLMGAEGLEGAIPAVAKFEGKALRKVIKSKPLKPVANGVGNVVDFILNRVTGLDEETRKFIKENPDISLDYIKGTKSSDDLLKEIEGKLTDLEESKLEAGKFYEQFKNDTRMVKISDAMSGIKGMLNDLGINVKNGTLDFGDISYSPRQKKAFVDAYEYIKTLESRGETASIKDVWRTRQLLDTIIDWDKSTMQGIDWEVANNIKDMRGRIDNILKTQVEGFKETDKEYSELTKAIKEFRKDWINKQTGQLNDNAGSKIRNVTNKANEKRFERLQKYIPTIKEDAKALSAAEAIDKATRQNVGQYTQSILLGRGATNVGLGYVLGQQISPTFGAVVATLGMLGIITPKNYAQLLVKLGKAKNSSMVRGMKGMTSRINNTVKGLLDWIDAVTDKLLNGEKLSQSQSEAMQKLLEENIDEIVANPEKYANYEYDRAQKSAYFGHESTEKKLLEEEIKNLDKKYEKKMKDIGFVRDIENGMLVDNMGYSDVAKKLYNWRTNVGDTTRQHEFFHSVFSLVDNKTKNYILDEAKKYLGLDEKKLGEKATVEAAEDWLAESFGVYIRRKEVKAGEIKLKGNRLQRFNAKLNDLFQRAYEWIQKYIVDRETIDKLFDEVYNTKLDKTGKLDLAEKLGINEKTSKLGGVDSPIKLKKKTGLGNKNDYTDNIQRQKDNGVVFGVSNKTRQATDSYGNLGDNSKGHSAPGGLSPFLVIEKNGNKSLNFNGELVPVNKEIKYDNRGYLGDNNKNIHKTKFRYRLNKGEEKYLDNFYKLVRETADPKFDNVKTKEIIGKTELGYDTTLSKRGLRHLVEHGEFAPENLIKTLQNPDYTGLNTDKNKPMYLKKIPNSDSYYVLGLEKEEKNGKISYAVTTFYEDTGKNIWSKYDKKVDNSIQMKFKKESKGMEGKDAGTQIGKIRYKRVWHGSPADFEKFDSSHMGEGEGAQAHGWGHYVAVDEKTGRHYAAMKDFNRDISIKGKELEAYKGTSHESIVNLMGYEIRQGGDANKVLEFFKKSREKGIEDIEKVLPAYSKDGDIYKNYKRVQDNYKNDYKFLSELEEGDITVNEIKGGHNLYEVEIPDPVKKDTPTGSNYLEEDKILSVDELKKFKELVKQWYGNDLWLWKGMDGRSLYNELTKTLGSKRSASWFLESLGYDGIHYFGGRDGEAYVIFGDDSAQIQNHVRYKKGYHGGGDFDEFDLSHSREGEGSEAHGYGVYITENKDRAKEYANLYRNNKYGYYRDFSDAKQFVSYKGMKKPEVGGEYGYLVRKVIDGMMENDEAYPYYDAKSQIAKQKRAINNEKNVMMSRMSGEEFNTYKKEKDNELRFLDSLDPKDFKVEDTKRNLYEVDVPNKVKRDTPTGSNYLEEEHILSKEEKNILKNALLEKIDGNKELLGRMSDYMGNMDGRTKVSGKMFYQRISSVLGSSKEASKFLQDLGYDGIHYIGELDGSSYVLFNDKGLPIKNHIRYKKDSTGRELSKGQQEYFKDSKIRDADGNLLRVYHGTHGDFTVFDRNKIGTNTNNKGIFGEGFYFTNRKNYGDYYAQPGFSKEYQALGSKSAEDIEKMRGKTMEGYLDIKNPFEWNKINTTEKMNNLIKELGLKQGDLRWNMTYKNQMAPIIDAKKSIKFRDALERAGYDGVIYEFEGNINGEKQLEYVVFDSNQFKNIDNLNPTKSEDIRYKKENTDRWLNSSVKGLVRKEGKIWEKTINPETGTYWTKKDIENKMNELGDRIFADDKWLNEIVDRYFKENDEITDNLVAMGYDKNGYVNPDGVRGIVNDIFSKEYGVNPNIMASDNHPLSKRISDEIQNRVENKVLNKAKNKEVTVAYIGGGGGSGKSGAPRAFLGKARPEEKGGIGKDIDVPRLIKKGETVDMVMDVQGGANDLTNFMEKAKAMGVDKNINVKVAYVFTPVEQAGKQAVYRTINKNTEELEKRAKTQQGLGKVWSVNQIVDTIKNSESMFDTMGMGRTLPNQKFLEGHIKSAGIKGLEGYINAAKNMDNLEMLVINKWEDKPRIIKKGGEFMVGDNELRSYLKMVQDNKQTGINLERMDRNAYKAYKEGKISKRQYMNFVSGLLLMLMLVGQGDNEN